MSKQNKDTDDTLKPVIQTYYGEAKPLSDDLSARIIAAAKEQAQMQKDHVILFFQNPLMRVAASAVLFIAAIGGYMSGVSAGQEAVISSEIVADGLYDIAWAMNGGIL